MRKNGVEFWKRQTMATTKCTFETIILFKRIPYWLYWPVIGIISFIPGEILIRTFEDNHFFWTQVLFSGAVGILPVLNIWLFHSFTKTMRGVSVLLWAGDAEFEKWLKIREARIFTLRSFEAKFVTGFVVVAGLIPVIILGLPFKSEIINIIGLIFFLLLLVICGHDLYISIDLIVTLEEIVWRPAQVPFFMLPHPAIYRLQKYYLTAAILYVLFYIGLVIAVWQGPYGFNYILIVWLTALAVYPLLMFFCSFFQVRTLLRNIKQSHLETVNYEVQQALEKVMNGHSLEETERLEKVMSIQNKIQNMEKGSITTETVITFLATLAIAIVQIVISVHYA